jgi:hypothetical protein
MTAASGSAPAFASGSRDRQPGQRRQQPPKAIQLLLPVWGESFIAQFLLVSLPTLLAPGNLPSIAKALPCKLIFLTSSEGADVLRDHPAIHYVQDICEVEIRIIDDLITGDNYSTTITLAYARAVRAAGAEMLDTCFFFLISDYIMADGSLANVLARMQAGYSGVVAGNFQVVEEVARKSFFSTFDTGGPEIVLRARDLMRWAMKYLHTMTLANMVNFPLSHSIHSNRLFWRVDENTLIGRFYLMHMICIQPEVANFEIGSSCDYSFIPEMCPSGNVHVLSDSDEYLVVEMQNSRHESNLVRLGSLEPNVLIDCLSEWTTAIHRKNAHSAVVYHTSDLPLNLETAITESAAYIDAIERLLPPPQPHRDHPYWLGAIAAHRWAVARRKSQRNPLRVFDAPSGNAGRFYDFLFRCRDFVFGRPPHVWPWHPRWSDYRMIRNLARRHFADKGGHLLVISSTPGVFQDWLSDISQATVSFDLGRLLNLSSDQYRPLIQAFDGCLLVLRESELSQGSELIGKIKPLLTGNNRLLIFAINGHGVALGGRFSEDLLLSVTGFFDPDLSLEDVQFVPAGHVTWMALFGMRSAFALVLKSWLWLPLAAVAAGMLIVVSFFCNLGRHSARQPRRNQVCSSLGLVMRKTTALLPEDYEDYIVEMQPLELGRQRFSKGRVRLASAGRAEQPERR